MRRIHYFLIATGTTLLLLGGSRYFLSQKNTKVSNLPSVSTSSPTNSPEPTPNATSTITPTQNPPKKNNAPPANTQTQNSFMRMLKDVGEPQYNNFGLTDTDFELIKNAGFNVIGVNFDICAGDNDVKYLLNTAQKYNLKVILPAGAGEAEWGYECESMPSETQGPVWQKDKVQQWVTKWKNYPAVYGWDSSNEDGLNFPNGENNPHIGEAWKKFSMTPDQLKTAYNDVKAVDSTHPIMIRMSGFVFYENENSFFGPGNYFANNVADIVMINAYSNYLDEYDGNFVNDIISKALPSVRTVDSDVKIIMALASWKESAEFKLSTISELQHDFDQVQQHRKEMFGIAYYKYGARVGQDWLFPDPARGSTGLWEKVKQFNNTAG